MEIWKSQAKSQDFEILYVFWVCFEPLASNFLGFNLLPNHRIHMHVSYNFTNTCPVVADDTLLLIWAIFMNNTYYMQQSWVHDYNIII